MLLTNLKLFSMVPAYTVYKQGTVTSGVKAYSENCVAQIHFWQDSNYTYFWQTFWQDLHVLC